MTKIRKDLPQNQGKSNAPGANVFTLNDLLFLVLAIVWAVGINFNKLAYYQYIGIIAVVIWINMLFSRTFRKK